MDRKRPDDVYIQGRVQVYKNTFRRLLSGEEKTVSDEELVEFWAQGVRQDLRIAYLRGYNDALNGVK